MSDQVLAALAERLRQEGAIYRRSSERWTALAHKEQQIAIALQRVGEQIARVKPASLLDLLDVLGLRDTGMGEPITAERLEALFPEVFAPGT